MDAECVKAETGKISNAIVCLTNPKRKREYDVHLAEQSGHMVEFHGDRVIPRKPIGAMGFLIGALCVVVALLLLWFTAQFLIDAIAPMLDQRNFL
jgi:hypothetical protein